MTNDDRLNATMIAVLAIVIAITGAQIARAFSLPSVAVASGFNAKTVWYFRFRVLNIRFDVLILGLTAYALPRTRMSAIGLRVAAALGVVGIATQIGEWLLEPGIPRGAGGAVSRGLGHMSDLVAFGAVIGLWFVAERRSALPEVGAPDLS